MGATRQFKSSSREDKLAVSYVPGAFLKWEKSQKENSEAAMGSLVSWIVDELVRVAVQL